MENMQIDFIAYNLISKEAQNNNIPNSFVEDKIINTKLFYPTKIIGSFFSCIYKSKLRIHIVFAEDTDEHNEELAILIRESIVSADFIDGKIWLCNTNYKVIKYLQDNFFITPDSEKFFYESYELIMPRSKFSHNFDSDCLDIRPYQEERIDDYLLLLNSSMSFKIPPYDYLKSKSYFLNEFRVYNEKNAFEAFWKNDELVGLYWLEGTEIDHIAVSINYQRSGYGTQILTRAIEVIFQNPEIDYAWLLVVGWNSKAFSFYRKYGFEVKAIHHVPYTNLTK